MSVLTSIKILFKIKSGHEARSIRLKLTYTEKQYIIITLLSMECNKNSYKVFIKLNASKILTVAYFSVVIIEYSKFYPSGKKLFI